MARTASSSASSRAGRCAALAAGALLLLATACSSIFSDPSVAIGSCDASRPAAGVQRLEVNDPIGSVNLSPSTDDQVSVTAMIAVKQSLREKFPAADAARDLKLETVGDALRIGSGHADDGHRDDFKIDLVIRAPARSAWKVVVGVGRIEVTADGNAVEATSGVGDVTLRGTAGTAHATSGVGNVLVEVASLGSGVLHAGTGDVRVVISGGTLANPLECSSGVGNVDVAVAPTLAADVQLHTGVGSVRCDGAALAKSSQFVGGAAEGRLGGGGPRLTASAGTGDVSLRVRR